MLVKIGDKVHNSNHEPIMLVLSKKDKENITNMAGWATKFCSYPKGTNIDIDKWMKTKN